MAREIDTTGVVEAGLDSEEFGLVCKCEGDTIDLLLDTGTVSNLVPEGQRESCSRHQERHYIPHRSGTQRQFGDKFQMINPHKDLVILRGWPRTKYANREYHFKRYSEDQLLHCKLKSTGEMAMMAKVAKFFRPEVSPNKEEPISPNALEPVKAMEDNTNITII